MKLPSTHRRDALSVDVLKSTTTGKFLRLTNVHLDSLWASGVTTFGRWTCLLTICVSRGCVHGIITGYFNAVGPEDEKPVDKRKGLLDA